MKNDYVFYCEITEDNSILTTAIGVAAEDVMSAVATFYTLTELSGFERKDIKIYDIKKL